MPSILERRRVLFAGFRPERAALLAQFDAGTLSRLGSGRSRPDRTGPLRPSNGAVRRSGSRSGLIQRQRTRSAVLASRSESDAVLLLAEATPGLVMEALIQGADHWLPRELALGCPALLTAQLQTAAMLGDLRRRYTASRRNFGGQPETGEPAGEPVVGVVAERRAIRMVQPTPYAGTAGRRR